MLSRVDRRPMFQRRLRPSSPPLPVLTRGPFGGYWGLSGMEGSPLQGAPITPMRLLAAGIHNKAGRSLPRPSTAHWPIRSMIDILHDPMYTEAPM